MGIAFNSRQSSDTSQTHMQQNEAGLKRSNAVTEKTRTSRSRSGSATTAGSSTSSSSASRSSRSTASSTGPSSAGESFDKTSSTRSTKSAIGMFAKGASMALSGALSKGLHGVVAKSIGQRNVADLSIKAEKKLDKATHKAMKADYKAADGKGLMAAALQGKAKPESLKAAMDDRKAKASAQDEGRAALKASTRKKFQAYGEGQQ